MVRIDVDHPKVMADPTSGCWIWIGKRSKGGYGQLSFDGRRTGAHRMAYMQAHGVEIPPHLELDHLCRVPACVNPQHLEAVSHGENLRRGESPGMRLRRAGQCRRGHDLAGAYVRRHDGCRVCKICRAAHARAFRARRKAIA